jgi:hypothetical protein
LRPLHTDPAPILPHILSFQSKLRPFIAEQAVLSSARILGLELYFFLGMMSYQVAAGMVREGAAAWKSLPEEAKALDGLELPGTILSYRWLGSA